MKVKEKVCAPVKVKVKGCAPMKVEVCAPAKVKVCAPATGRRILRRENMRKVTSSLRPLKLQVAVGVQEWS